MLPQKYTRNRGRHGAAAIVIVSLLVGELTLNRGGGAMVSGKLQIVYTHAVVFKGPQDLRKMSCGKLMCFALLILVGILKRWG